METMRRGLASSEGQGTSPSRLVVEVIMLRIPGKTYQSEGDIYKTLEWNGHRL